MFCTFDPRFMLSGYNTSDPIYFACEMIFNGVPFPSGTAYVLSKESVRRFITGAVGDPSKG